MKHINFPEPKHEKAMGILEQAHKELEALGYEVVFTKEIISNEQLPAGSYTVFHMKFTASISC